MAYNFSEFLTTGSITTSNHAGVTCPDECWGLLDAPEFVPTGGADLPFWGALSVGTYRDEVAA